ncbi:MAG TPA: AAA family ATPase [Thioalkalivibrio sp.]|nr:AAA family ATPase [Thioalkalivibrio sp.]
MDCLLRHGLERQPFDAVAGDVFLYTDPALDMPLGVLLEHLHNDDNLLIFKGDTGAGKSTQLLRLLSRGAETLDFCAFKARPGTSFAAIDYTIRQFWGEAAGASEEMPLAQLLCSLGEGTRRPALVIDDAHHIDSTVLAELLQLRRDIRTQCDRVPGMLLVGEPRLELQLEQATNSELPGEAHISVLLRPLTREQTEAYLRHRMQVAGANDPDLLSGDLAQAIHQESAGLPLNINAAANRQLQFLGATPGGAASPAPRAQATLPLWQQPWFRPAAGGVIIVVVLLILMRIFSSPGDEALETRELLVLPEPRALVSPEPAQEPPAEAPAPATPTQTVTESVPEELPETPAALPEPIRGSLPAPEPADQPPSETAPQADPEPPVQAEPTAPATPQAPPATPRTEATGLHDASWLTQQPATHYTLQILGLSELQALRNYARDQSLEGDVAWFRTQRNNQDWFVLVAGNYPDAEAARDAIASLPAEVRRNQPWIRSFRSIQQAMSQAR